MPPVDPNSVKTIYKNETIHNDKKKLTPYDLDESFRDNLIHEDENNDDSDEDSDEREFNARNNAKFSLSIKKKRKLTGKKLGRPAKQEDGKELDYQCHVCDSAFHSNSNLAKHYKYSAFKNQGDHGPVDRQPVDQAVDRLVDRHDVCIGGTLSKSKKIRKSQF